MYRFILLRLLLFIPTVLGVVTFTFLLIHLVPGDPVVLMLGDYATKQEIEQTRSSLNLDKPISTQYVLFLDDLLHGNLGTSIYYKKPVAGLVFERFKYTFVLAVFAMLLSLIISIPLGLISGYEHDKWLDKFVSGVSILGISLPNFWIGIMLIMLFAIKLNILPVAGADSVSSIILPGLTLAIGMSAITIRMIRANAIKAINQDNFAMNLAKGISVKRNLFIHTLKATLVPVITLIGMQFGLLLSGAIVTETVFSWPGMGRLLVDSVMTRDYPLLSGDVLVVAFVYVTINLITDIIYYIADPRMIQKL
ncbi:MAG: ABC transporter permease [Deltaproteobacteria bacterium]|nr:ABC transporter permease [Deltaproteobacteria bacterium]MCL5792691.1 ABC transporter permease [Deltaproteobacteria bacterium]